MGEIKINKNIMRYFLIITFSWVMIFFTISMIPKNHGEYIHWDNIKIRLVNHPQLTIIDFQTGINWDVVVGNENILRSLHADVEPKSLNDSQQATEIWGGFSWEARPVLVFMPDGELVAASIHNMPHAGIEEEPYLKIVKNRTAGYGEGVNRDYVKNNGMSGHVCLHFLGSKSHKTKKEILQYQDAVKMAANINLH